MYDVYNYVRINNFHWLIVIDSLLCNEHKEEDAKDIESCFELQCNQVFIGMVTMQYQAQADMVTHNNILK